MMRPDLWQGFHEVETYPPSGFLICNKLIYWNHLIPNWSKIHPMQVGLTEQVISIFLVDD